MARLRKKNSQLSFGGLGLSKKEDRELIRKLFREDTSLKKLLRKLVRNWLRR